jgi:antitoxin (DNA-binding transcriptional repressor) of toxin-antitoxin stability system
MSRTISQRELRNDSGAIMRGLDKGETFVVTRRGVPVGELIPIRRRRFAPRQRVAEVFAGAAPLDRDRFVADVDEWIDQDAAPRG